MAEEIVNRVAKSPLITFDLEALYCEGERIALDLSQWLDQGFILREKDFRNQLKNHDWSSYQDTFIALYCSTDAVVPAWASMLVSTYLQPFTQKVVLGTLEQLEVQLFYEKIGEIDTSTYENKPIIIKGCSNKPVPKDAYIQLISKLQPVAKSLFYGEACSSVPLFKQKK